MTKYKYLHSTVIAVFTIHDFIDFNNLQNLCFIVIDDIHALKVYLLL